MPPRMARMSAVAAEGEIGGQCCHPDGNEHNAVALRCHAIIENAPPDGDSEQEGRNNREPEPAADEPAQQPRALLPARARR